MSAFSRLLLVGCGKMGSALLSGWEASQNRNFEIAVIEPAVVSSSFTSAAVTAYPSPDALPPSFIPDVVVFAVKPQMLSDTLPAYAKRFAQEDITYISIAAGKTLAFFSEHLGQVTLVRAMPNTPALVGKGITALVANEKLSPEKKPFVEALFASVGDVVWLTEEAQMDVATAISGSGPAYVFYFMEALLAAAKEAGLPDAIARKLVYKTLEGSVALADDAYSTPLATLRANVTSPGGTTEAALRVLMQDDALALLIQKAVTAAITRAEELRSASA